MASPTSGAANSDSKLSTVAGFVPAAVALSALATGVEAMDRNLAGVVAVDEKWRGLAVVAMVVVVAVVAVAVVVVVVVVVVVAVVVVVVVVTMVVVVVVVVVVFVVFVVAVVVVVVVVFVVVVVAAGNEERTLQS